MYPNSSFGRALKSVATLIRADVGIEAAQVDIGGWDTHAAQGGAVGAQATLANDFASSLAAFHADIVATNARVTVVVISEFGRNAKENGSQGTDHGRASTMFAMGQGIAGGRVLSLGTNGLPGWPGLATDQLEQTGPTGHSRLSRRAVGNRAEQAGQHAGGAGLPRVEREVPRCHSVVNARATAP